MPRKARDVAANLRKKGFQERSGDHAYFHLYIGEIKTRVRTKISQGEREIHDGLLAQMARDVRLVKREFLELVDCPMTSEAYLEHLRKHGHISMNDDGRAD